MNYQRKSIGRENAKTLAATEWWKEFSYEQSALIALTIEELTMPLNLLRFCVEQSFGYAVPESDIAPNVDAIIHTIRQRFEVIATPDQVVALVWPTLSTKSKTL